MPTTPASPLAFGIGSALADVKRERGLSGEQIAELTGHTQSQVSRWLNSRVDISAGDLIDLCDGLGLDFREFLDTARRRASEYELRTSSPESSTPGDSE